MVSVICRLIGRYTTPFGYSSMKMTQQVSCTQEVAGRVEFNTLLIENDSSEFCGVWIADHADINTKKMTVTGTKQTVDIESEMSGYSVSFGNVFNPFVTGAVASALPTYSNFSSDGKQHITQYTPSFVYFKDAHYNVGEMHLKNGMITGEKADGKIGVVIEEHLKNRVEMEHHSRSFSMNPGAMLSFGMNPGLINSMMAVPVDRKVSQSSVHESYAQSGMHIKENHIEIGEKIEIKPELENQEHLKVRDTAPVSSIGSIMAGVQEINTLLDGIKRDAAERQIHDAKVEQVIEDVKQITGKSDEKTVEMQDKLDAIEVKTKHAINENIAEISENLSGQEVEDLSKKNIEILESIVYESAKEKVAVVEARIAELEQEKASVNVALRCVETSQELGDAFYDSAIDGLKSVLKALNYTIENPGEVLQSACEISLHLGKKAVDFAQYCVENPDLIYDKVILKSKELYEYTRDNLGECELNVAEYVPGIGGILEGSRDFYKIYEEKTEPRTVADKWRNYGLFAAVLGKGGRKTAESIVEILQEAEVKAGAKQFNLTRYGGPGGGHHIHMKSAYKSHPLYDLNEALCLNKHEMAKLGIDHQTVTNAQRRMCIELRKSGRELTRDVHNEIQVKALIEGGASEQVARDIVAHSLIDLKRKGVRAPTDMPYSSKKEKK